MNQEVRKFLIDQCVKGEPIYYEVIGRLMKLDLNNQEDRNVLSKALGSISTFEHQKKRPLISSIAIYKPQSNRKISEDFTSVHGNGFYNLCEELGIGKSSKLAKEYYGFTQIEECKKFWQKAENYAAYYNLDEEKIIHNLDFFTTQEIEFLATWGGRVYDKNNEEHFAAKEYIKNSLGTKTKYWSEQLVKAIGGLDTYNRRIWSQRGWTETKEGKAQISQFKSYTWARIFRIGDKDKHIFFNVGIDGNSKNNSLGLFYKIDYYFEKSSNLDDNQMAIVKKNIPKELSWKLISKDELGDYDWNSLIEKTAGFISEHLNVYDRLIQLAWGDDSPEEVFTSFLRPQNPPENGIDVLPELNPNFAGVDKDFTKEAIENKEIGDAGEELVLQYEINRIKNGKHPDLAEEVKIEKDGKGYDILSFDENRNPKYIEVKTTRGKNLTPFYFSINEKLFAEKNPNKYFIYRLYNFDEESNTADFYEIQNINESLLMQPIAFKVYIKKRDKNMNQ